MKAASPELVALLGTGEFFSVDGYTITLTGGTVLRLSTAPFDVTWGGHTFTANPRIGYADGAPLAQWTTKLDVGQWNFQIHPRFYDDFSGSDFLDMLNGEPFLAAAISGVFTAASVLVERAFFAVPFDYPAAGVVPAPVGFIPHFYGLVGEVSVSDTAVSLQVNDFRILLSTMMPRNLYQASCPHRLFDSDCTLNPASFSRTGTTGLASTRQTIVAVVGSPLGSATYALGKITMTSGKNAGQQRMVSEWPSTDTFHLQSPLPYAPALGDTFTITPGCNKTMFSCLSFGNINNFRGTPYIPLPETLL